MFENRIKNSHKIFHLCGLSLPVLSLLFSWEMLSFFLLCVMQVVRIFSTLPPAHSDVLKRQQSLPKELSPETSWEENQFLSSMGEVMV